MATHWPLLVWLRCRLARDCTLEKHTHWLKGKNRFEESEMNESKRRAPRYTLKFKLEAVRLVKGAQVAAVKAKILGIPKQTLENWVR
jgi:hypothetical protein